MLPQMSPLPWVFVYFSLFLVFIFVLMWSSYFLFSNVVSKPLFVFSKILYCW